MSLEPNHAIADAIPTTAQSWQLHQHEASALFSIVTAVGSCTEWLFASLRRTAGTLAKSREPVRR